MSPFYVKIMDYGYVKNYIDNLGKMDSYLYCRGTRGMNRH